MLVPPVEFSRLCQQWGAFEWAWLSSFRADMAVYKVGESQCCNLVPRPPTQTLSRMRLLMLYLPYNVHVPEVELLQETEM